MLNKPPRQPLLALLRCNFNNMTQRQAILGIISLLIVFLLARQIGLINNPADNADVQVSNGIGLILIGGLWLAYWQRWKYARYILVIIISLMLPLTLSEPILTISNSFIIFIPPILALILAEPIWVIGSAILTLGTLLLRTGGQGVYASVENLFTYSLLIGCLVISRLIVAAARREAQMQAKAAEEALAFAQEKRRFLRTIIDHIPIMLALIDAKEQVTLVNREWEQALGWPMETIKDFHDLLENLYPDPMHRQTVIKLAETDAPEWREFVTTTNNGRTLDVIWAFIHLSDDSIIVIGRDITTRKQLQEQLYQAQKMDAIGQLAAGIAHDFNNLLVPIIGYVELTMMKVPQESNLYVNLTHIQQAAEQAARLTSQILAFGRKQMLEVKSFVLNDVIDALEPLFQRVIGEDVELRTQLASALWSIKADKSLLEQVLLNLVVNARDAMPDGGSLTIETDNVFLDEKYTTTHLEVQSGPYVLLAVSDTGHGMDAETQAHIFEPFFTTKEPGKGTGLGLATIYGIIKQHGGSIWVYSEVDQGTTFKVYLPQTTDAAQDVASPTELISTYGTETVLVVEDSEMARNLIRDTLEVYGYNVLEAQNPSQCLDMVSVYTEPIHLLLTDVIMPEMNGRQLYNRISEDIPDIKVLYISGYTGNVIARRGILQENVNFLQKPFTIRGLTRKVREVIDQDMVF
jgi:two-component system, cell cycle sensor histidine kinase and response regulator CckA